MIDIAPHGADCGGLALLMTANVKRLPADYIGVCGMIGQLYSEHGVKTALAVLAACLHDGRTPGPSPAGLELSTLFASRCGLANVVLDAS